MKPEYAYEANDSLGISLKPGNYVITLNNKIHFSATHNHNNQRLTPYTAVDSTEQSIAFLGCSFTYGYGVNDDETFISNLQTSYPNWSFDNYGVIGYGSVQSLLQLKEIIRKGETNAVLLTFSSFHFMRNALTQTYRKNLKLGYAHSAEAVDSVMKKARFPFISSCDCEPQYARWETMHENCVGREYLASVNWIQTLSEQYKDHKLDPIALTTCLLKKMHVMCEEANISFAVVCLDSTNETEQLHANLSDIQWLDVKFDFESTSKTFTPYDSHPNASGHKFIAEEINPFLNQLIEDE